MAACSTPHRDREDVLSEGTDALPAVMFTMLSVAAAAQPVPLDIYVTDVEGGNGIFVTPAGEWF
jgi:hypothetical protein